MGKSAEFKENDEMSSEFGQYDLQIVSCVILGRLDFRR